MKKLFAVMLVFVLALAIAGCGGSDPATYVDGTFTAHGEAAENGYIKATITIEGDEITAVEFVEYNQYNDAKDYATYGGDRFTILEESHNDLAAAMVEANSWDVDDVTGATSTSTKAKSAVKLALEKALADQPDEEYVNGTIMGVSSMDDRGGMVVALVTINNDTITAVNLRETTRVDDALTFKGEDYGSEAAGFTYETLVAAHDAMATAFVEANGTDVELVSGATGTSTKAIEAVEDALKNAKR